MLFRNYKSGSESQAEIYRGYVTLHLSKRVENLRKCAFVKGWQRCLGNLHRLHSLYLCIHVGCTQQILHVSQAAPLKICMSGRLQLSTMAAALVTPPSMKVFPIFLQQINSVALQFCMSAWLHLANVTCRTVDTFVLKICQAMGHKNAWRNLSSSMQTSLYDAATTNLLSLAEWRSALWPHGFAVRVSMAAQLTWS